MKTTKVMSALLASVMAAGSSGIMPLATAAEDTVLYDYIDENNNVVGITQSELNEGNWNAEALGDVAPNVYEDFPADIDTFVNDYSELQLAIRYMKNIDQHHQASIEISDMSNDATIFESELTESIVYSDVLDIDKTYKLTLEITDQNETSEYYKIVKTYNDTAEMPDYVINSQSGGDIMIADVDDLKASTVINDDGEIEIDGTMPRYTSVASENFSTYCSALDQDTIYRIYTRDEDSKLYEGFISVSQGGYSIYTPSIELISWDTFNTPSTYALPSSNYVTASRVKSANKIEMATYRDYSYSFKSTGTSYFRVFSYELNDDSVDYGIELRAKSGEALGVQIWKASSLTATPVHCYTSTGRNGRITLDFVPYEAYGADIGDYLFFVVYLADASNGQGYISAQPIDYSDDVTGMAYEAYADGGSLSLPTTTYTLTDDRDADVFYVSYTGSSQKTYRALINNKVETTSANKTAKYLEITYNSEPDEDFAVGPSPMDLVKVASGVQTGYNFVAGYTMQAFVYVYSADSTSRTSKYSLSYNQK